VNNPELWEALKEYLKHLKTLELQALVVATSEQEIFRKQGKVNFLDNLLTLPAQVKAAKEFKDDNV
jgi:ATP adenylyltransferase/5',5'''-P-1,P-4-tetraphosphate phosphorylase II